MENATDLAGRVAEALGPGFAVERPLGEGGFASVFLVSERALGRRLAVKALSPDLLATRTALERFEREAATVAQLSHPHIVPLHFVGGSGEMRVLAMGYVDGGTAADRLQADGPWSPDAVRRLLREVADALAYAHRRGVIHRDVKPANILLDAESGRAMLTDFGIARGAESGLTATGLVVGTPAYLAPEQVTGEPASPASDLYALGLVGYQLLVGGLPFEGTTPTATMLKRLSEPPQPIRERRRDVPAPLAALIMRCLAQAPDERPASADAVVEALDAMPTGGATATASRRPLLAAVGAAVVVTLGSLAWWQSRMVPPAPARAVASDDTTWWSWGGGTVRIGDDADRSPPPRLAAAPAHAVTLGPFRLARRAATIGDVRRWAAAQQPMLVPELAGDPLAPVRGLTWTEAAAFCAWIVPDGRLPTEAEWETAARALGDRAEMIGRGWEWTSSPAESYPGGPPVPARWSTFRVIRGGSAGTPASLLTPALRGYASPDAPRRDVVQTGVRCARAAGTP